MVKKAPAANATPKLEVGTRLVLWGDKGIILATIMGYDADSNLFTTEYDVYASFTTTGYCSPPEGGYISMSMWLADRMFEMTAPVDSIEVI